MGRVRQRDIRPTAIKPRLLGQEVLVNTDAETLGPFVLNNGASLSVLSITESTVSEEYRIATAPYNIVFFQDSLATGNIIGKNITGDYTINGPMGVPQFLPHAQGSTVGGNNGNNNVFITELINNSGSQQTIYTIIDSRVFVPTGGES